MSVSVAPVYGADIGAFGRHMATETKKPNQETWRAWLNPGVADPEPLITRDEMLTRLQRLNIEVKLSDLRYWEYEGILPRPVRKWDPEVKARRAYYPVWFMASIIALRELQDAGLHLRDLQPALQFAAAHAARELSLTCEDGPIELDAIALEEGVTENDVVDATVLGAAVQVILEVVFSDSVVPALARYARLLDRLDIIDQQGKETTHAEFRLTNSAGELTWEQRRFSLPKENEHR